MSFLDKTRVALRPLLLPTFCLAQLLDALNISGANIALPRIKDDLGFTTSSLQWVLSAYALTFGGFLMLTGRLGDVYGHRNLFIIGLLWFTVFAVVTGYSTSSTMMIVARGFQGIGAASTIPNAVGLILCNYEKGRPRNKAMSIFGSVAALGFVFGLVIGGVVTESPLGWRWIFYISGIVSGLMSIMGVLVIPKEGRVAQDDKSQKKQTIDVWGALLSTASVLLFVYVLTDANVSGWSNPRIISLLTVSVALIAIFIFVESKIKQPLMPLSLWRLPNFSASFVIAACLLGFFNGYFYYITLMFQDIFHYSPTQATLRFLPTGVVAGLVSLSAERVIHHFNIKRCLVAGLTLGVIGNIILGWYYEEGQYWTIAFPSFIITVGGLSSVYVSTTISALESASPDVAGIVGGMLNTSFQVGGGLGLAILVAVASSVIPADPNPSQADILKSYHAALWTGLGLIVIALIVAVFFIRSPDDLKKMENGTRDEEMAEKESVVRMEDVESDKTIVEAGVADK